MREDGSFLGPRRYGTRVLRAFLALDLDERFLRQVRDRIDALRSSPLSHARWVSPHTLHVTLRFLGPTDETLVSALAACVAELGAAVPSPIEVDAAGWVAFPSARRAHVLALDLSAGAGLKNLATGAELAATKLGFAPEGRPFRPHLTVARFRRPADVRALAEGTSEPLARGSLVALTLYASDLGREGPVHTALARHTFGSASKTA